jgi:hypothetical protein
VATLCQSGATPVIRIFWYASAPQRSAIRPRCAHRRSPTAAWPSCILTLRTSRRARAGTNPVGRRSRGLACGEGVVRRDAGCPLGQCSRAYVWRPRNAGQSVDWPRSARAVRTVRTLAGIRRSPSFICARMAAAELYEVRPARESLNLGSRCTLAVARVMSGPDDRGLSAAGPRLCSRGERFSE